MDIPPAVSRLHEMFPGPFAMIGAFAQADWYAALRLGLTRIAVSLDACSKNLVSPGERSLLAAERPLLPDADFDFKGTEGKSRISRSAPTPCRAHATEALPATEEKPASQDKAPTDAPTEAPFRPSARFRRTWRVLTNSMLPERALAFAVGLGTRGRSHLLLSGKAGPAVLLGILVTPLDADLLSECASCVVGLETCASTRDQPDRLQVWKHRKVPGHDCGSCSVCIDACPTKALGRDGEFSRFLCLQNWTTVPAPIPQGILRHWGSILYGCDICTSVCPRRVDLLPMCEMPPGRLGPSLPARWFTGTPLPELKAALRGTALGLNRIPVELLVRNALCVTGMSQGEGSLVSHQVKLQEQEQYSLSGSKAGEPAEKHVPRS